MVEDSAIETSPALGVETEVMVGLSDVGDSPVVETVSPALASMVALVSEGAVVGSTTTVAVAVPAAPLSSAILTLIGYVPGSI